MQALAIVAPRATARRAAERDEAAIAAWQEETWPVLKDGGGPGRLALVALVENRLKRMQYRPGLIDGFLAGTGLDLTLP